MRELTLSRVAHPDPLPVEVAGPGVTLVVDPVADPIVKGDPTLGWEGDERLGLYFNVPRRCFELWRFEADGQYRRVARRGATGRDGINGPEAVAQLIAHLVTHDSQRRGYDVKADLDARNAAIDRAATRATADRVTNELAPKLAWALNKDGLGDHTSGADRSEMVAFGEAMDAAEAAQAEEA